MLFWSGWGIVKNEIICGNEALLGSTILKLHLKLVLSAGESVSVVGWAGSDLGRTHIWFSGLLYPPSCDESSSGYFPVRTSWSFPLSCLTPSWSSTIFLPLLGKLPQSFTLTLKSESFQEVCFGVWVPSPSPYLGLLRFPPSCQPCPASPVIGGVTCHIPICLRPVTFMRTSGFLVAMKILSCLVFFLFVQRLRIFFWNVTGWFIYFWVICFFPSLLNIKDNISTYFSPNTVELKIVM